MMDFERASSKAYAWAPVEAEKRVLMSDRCLVVLMAFSMVFCSVASKVGKMAMGWEQVKVRLLWRICW